MGALLILVAKRRRLAARGVGDPKNVEGSVITSGMLRIIGFRVVPGNILLIRMEIPPSSRHGLRPRMVLLISGLVALFSNDQGRRLGALIFARNRRYQDKVEAGNPAPAQIIFGN